MTERHSRQIPMIGRDGQRRLRDSKAAVIGLGGLGCNVITHLASAGIGNFVIADCQSPEQSNLNRQFVYSENDTGKRKTAVSAEWIKRLDPSANVTELDIMLDDGNADRIGKCDIIMDCLDNNRSRLILNRYAHRTDTVLVHGGVGSTVGQVTVVVPGATPCLECILTDPQVSEVPSVSPMVGIIGSVQAMEAVKILSGKYSPLSGKLLSVDVSDNTYRVIDIKRKIGCGCCSAPGE